MSEWKEYRLTDFIDINPKVNLRAGEAYSFVEMKDLSESQKYVRPSQLKVLKGGAKFQTADTLFARITPCLENGKIAQVRGLQNAVGFGSTEFLVFRGKKGISSTDFVYYLSRSEIVRKFAEQNMVGTSGRQRVAKDAFENLIIELPDLPKQTAIAEILSALDDKIELNHKINQELEKLAQTLFKQWFIDFEFPNENGEPYKSAGGEMVDSELGEIPKGWEVVQLSDVVEVKGGSTPSTKNHSYWNGNIHWTSPRDLSSSNSPFLFDTEKRISGEGLRGISSGLLPRGTVLLSSRAPIGYLAITEIETAINQGYIAINSKSRVTNSFIYLWLKANMNSVFERANGSTFLEISKSNFKQIKTFLPTSNLVSDFAKQIDLLFIQIRVASMEIRELSQLRDTLLPKLISGELELNDIEL